MNKVKKQILYLAISVVFFCITDAILTPLVFRYGGLWWVGFFLINAILINAIFDEWKLLKLRKKEE